MKYILIIIMIFISGIAGLCQDIDSLLLLAKDKNLKIIALDKWLEVEAVNSKTGINPENPQISYNYLFGNPADIGDQTELDVTQSFRLPGYYKTKKDIQALQYQQKVLLVEKEKRKTYFELSETYIDIVWLMALQAHLEKRKSDSEKLVQLIEFSYKKGEVSKAVYDNARINDINIRNDFSQVENELNVKKELLETKLGRLKLDTSNFSYPDQWLLPDEDSLFVLAKNNAPELKQAELEIMTNKKAIKHEKYNRLPELEAGYKSEQILNQKLQGFHIGISIPLWQNLHKVESAKLSEAWSKLNYDQKDADLNAELKLLVNDVYIKHEALTGIQEIMKEENIMQNKMKLFQEGEISFAEYMTEIQLVTEAQLKFLKLERDYYVGLAKLWLFYR